MDSSRSVVHRGVMLSGVPNAALAIGYTNSSWTLKVGMLWKYITQLIGTMDAKGLDTAVAVADPDMATRPALDFEAGYVQRALAELPRQGEAEDWRMSMSYFEDAKRLNSELSFGEESGLRLSSSKHAKVTV